MGIPMILGVTGHRDLIEEHEMVLEKIVHDQLKRLINTYPHTKLHMVNSLAAGADQLCAKMALELGIELVAVLPMEKKEYEKDFQGKSLETFRSCLHQAKEVFVAPVKEKSTIKDRDFYYRQAGIYIASVSHLLLALWDGNKEDVSNCGTAAVVDFMLHPFYNSEDSPFKAMNDGAVLQISTPRKSNPNITDPFEIYLHENDPGVLAYSLNQTDRFNQDAATIPIRDSNNLLDQELLPLLGPICKEMHENFQISDGLSVAFRDKYLRSMLQISIFAVMMVLAFLLYNQLDQGSLLIGYGLFLLSMFVVLRRTNNRKYQQKYLEYRVLSESIRVQFYLLLIGIHHNICENLTWPNRPNNIWIRDGVTSLLAGSPENAILSSKELKELWIEDQLSYHIKKRKEDIKKEALQSLTKKIMMGASIVSFLFICVLRLIDPLVYAGTVDLDLVRKAFDLFMGVISSAAVFTSNYYGKLSLNRKIADHDKMIQLYRLASTLYEHPGFQKELVFKELAKESMIENGDWLTYCRQESLSMLI
ncbi:hypothetical protein J0B03_00255 [Alkalibacter rhizosphaerae]|uniref:SMODS and SLOG-associating 2TM effector domain-containing protein n=1 Tax=Alkalibacter rhizosphaerae TaxID=2815577 RepID=A0A974XEU9_9FIRM|nr:hypothetical protein [Alkalibacter rhizosphaerae]QSX08562.1 hypothetical protein J0B03_00255 [Alkalibacter rhizosphaerae]